MSAKRSPQTLRESMANNSTQEREVVLTSKRKVFIEAVVIFLVAMNFLHISGGYDWMFRGDTVDTVMGTLSIVLGVAVVAFLRLLKEDE